MSNEPQQSRLFSEQELDNMDGNLFAEREQSGPVTCLGMEFESDEARREYFRAELRKKLPELRHIEGFPIGEDDDIIALSDPPYYTACPNPWLNDFIAQWESEKADLEARGLRTSDFEVKEPYATDIKVGKNHPIYNAHGYHTKVPHYVIMNYYLHYTQPGDIVVDNFGGTGMAGVAANYCGAPDADARAYFDQKWKDEYGKKPNWGFRNAIIGDLSPICSFITYNYTNTVDAERFKQAAEKIFTQLKKELGHLYQYKLNGQNVTVNYTIWSEVQVCPHCSSEFVLWDAAVDFHKHIQLDKYECPHCNALIQKRKSLKAFETVFDDVIGDTTTVCKFVPVVINYGQGRNRAEKELSIAQRDELNAIYSSLDISSVPVKEMPEGYNTNQPISCQGYHYTYQFFTKRNLHILLRFRQLIEEYDCDERLRQYLRIWFTSCHSRLHMMNRYAVNHHRHVGPLANTLYISGTPTEISPFYFIESKIGDNILHLQSSFNVVNHVASATHTNIKDNSIDYIFTDPPFGANIMYSELNLLLESWLNLFTNNEKEAICNPYQQKGLPEYLELMVDSFKEYYRILKPGRWITVEFSNTAASVWNTIQTALQKAGFIVVAVSDLNKGRGGLKGITTTTAVNQDLAISCYKPTDGLTQKFQNSSDTAANVWDFVSELLEHLPVHVIKEQKTTTIVERSPKILFDRVIAYYVQHGYPVPLNAQEFQKGLRERFIELDGMFFTAPQAAEYKDKKREAPEMLPMGLIVSDEANGIEWLKLELKTPQTYQEIQPKWLQAVGAVRKNDIIPELRQLLEENFIEEANGKWRLPNIQDDKDVAALRTKALMREFKLYVEQASKPKGKIKEARVEALRAGFKQCYIDKDFKTIVMVGDRIPANLRDEDEVLLQFYDIALNKI